MPDPRAKFVTLYKLSRVQKFSIFESPIINSVCPPILHKLLFSNAPESTEYFRDSWKQLNLQILGGKRSAY